jgi:hypothetical protein
MPMLKWSAPVGGPHGGTLEIRAPGGEVLYTLVDSIPEFIEPSHVASITSQITTLVPGAVVTIPAGAQ